MKKLYPFLFLSLALLMSGCRNRGIITTPMSTSMIPANTMDQSSPADVKADEDVKAFELNEDGNPFNTSATQESQVFEEENLTTNKSENSNKHGFRTIYYEFNESDLRPDQVEAADKNAEIAKNLVSKGNIIEIEGHACDSAGSDEYNMHLSEDRAQKLKGQFVKHGIDKSKLSTVGRGSRMLIVAKGDRMQQAPNRRVEVYAYPEKK